MSLKSPDVFHQVHKEHSRNDVALRHDSVSTKANWTPQTDVTNQIRKTNDNTGALLHRCADPKPKEPDEWLLHVPKHLLQDVFSEVDTKHYTDRLNALVNRIEISVNKFITKDIINMAKAFVISGTPDAQPINLLHEATGVIYSGSGISIHVIQKKLCFFAYIMNIGLGKPTLKSISERVARDLGIELSPGLVLYINGHCCKKEIKTFKDEWVILLYILLLLYVCEQTCRLTDLLVRIRIDANLGVDGLKARMRLTKSGRKS